MDKLESAKRILLHYFKHSSNVTLDNDCKVEILGIVDDIVDAAFSISSKQLKEH